MPRLVHRMLFEPSRLSVAGLGLLVLLGFGVERGHSHDPSESDAGSGCSVCATVCAGKVVPAPAPSAAANLAPCACAPTVPDQRIVRHEIRTALHSRAPPAAPFLA